MDSVQSGPMLMYWLMVGLFATAALLHKAPSMLIAHAPGTAARAPHPAHANSVAMPFTAMLLIVLIGLRYRVGGDWLNYLRDFRVTGQRELIDAIIISQGELGYTLLNWIAVQAGAGIWLVNLVCAVPFAIGLTRLCRLQPNPWLALVVATPILIIVVAMGFTRQAAALGFLMMGLSAMSETRSIRSFVFFVLMGALFHRTVLVFIPIVLAMFAKNKFLTYVFIVGALIVGYSTILTSVFARYNLGYLKAELDAAGATVRIGMNVVPALVLLLSNKSFFFNEFDRRIWRAFALFSVASGVALTIVQSSAIVDRLAMYLIPMQLVVLGRIPYVFSKGQGSVVGWSFLVVCYSVLVLGVWLNYATYSPAWIPYRNYLSEGF